MVSKIDKELYLLDGYMGKYTITKDGEVYSQKGLGKWKKLKHYMVAGYPAVTLMKNKVRVIKHIHRLLATTFIPNPLNKKCVNHIDGNRLNHDLSNLEWCTHSENTIHAIETGLIPKKVSSYIPVNVVKSVYLLKDIYRQKDLCDMFNLKPFTVNRIHNKKAWVRVTSTLD